MEFKINNKDIKVLENIFSKLVIQSQHHENNVKEIFKILRQELEKQFSEDNWTTMDNFIIGCIYNSLKGEFYRDGIKKLLDDNIICPDKSTSSIPSQKSDISDNKIIINNLESLNINILEIIKKMDRQSDIIQTQLQLILKLLLISAEIRND